MGRPLKWSGPTRAIRVPDRLADHLLDIARQLDNPEPDNNVQNPSGLPICKPAADAATIAQGLAEGWIAHKLPQYPQMLTSDSHTGTYRLFLAPSQKLSPLMEQAVGEYCDQLFDELDEAERVFLLSRLIEELGERVA